VRPCSAMGRVPVQAIASESLPRQRQRMRRTLGYLLPMGAGQAEARERAFSLAKHTVLLRAPVPRLSILLSCMFFVQGHVLSCV
jgi:hypothetical protein